MIQTSRSASLAWLLACTACVAALVLASGCASFFSHNVHVAAPDIPAALVLRSSAEKRVAVVLDPATVKFSYDSKLGFHHWSILGASTALGDNLRATLQGKVREVAVFPGRAEGGFDAYVYPQLQAHLKMGWTSLRCVVTVALQLQDARGTVRASQSHEVDEVCSPGREPEIGHCCSTAIAGAMSEVATPVLSRIDQL